MIPTLPLKARNRLAEAILEALRDPAARRRLGELADGVIGEGWLEVASPEATALLRRRAQCALEALARLGPSSAEPALAERLTQAAALFDAGLGFEVHELLEPHWVGASGEARSALQGLIQIAVGYQHLANGNVAGARALLQEGSDRVRGCRLAGVDLDPFAHAVADTVPRVADPTRDLAPPDFPRA